MYHSNGLEYIVRGYCSSNYLPNVSYLSGNIDDKPDFRKASPIVFEAQYKLKTSPNRYKIQPYHSPTYAIDHSFTPEFFLNSSRPKARFVDDNNEVKCIAEETFELIMKERMSESISINILPLDEFKSLHSRFGSWSNGIQGFSINKTKKIFVRENHLDALMLVIGHEIGHVLTEALPNKHDEEAKAFAFSIEWAKTIKQHNISNLGLNIKDELDFQPAKNGLHDIALEFVDFMIKKGRKAMELHEDLTKKYTSIFNGVYF